VQIESDASNCSITSYIKNWLGILVAASPLLLFAGCIGYAFYLDQQQKTADSLVDRLCIQDGGLTVYEQVMAPAHYFKFKGDPPSTPSESQFNKPEDIFVVRALPRVYLQNNKPRIAKHELLYIRRHDNKILARGINYVRYDGSPFFFLEWIAKYSDDYSCRPKIVGNPESKLYINYFQPSK
jgi:hypothetical protein